MIIVNDNPGDNTTDNIRSIGDSRIVFFENETNQGVNASRNLGLANVSNESNYVIFLDDDDYLTPDALGSLKYILTKNPHQWLVTARGASETQSNTSASANLHAFYYVWDYLIAKKIKGDATHCVNASLIKKYSLHFPTRIPQAEEWLFYFSLSRLVPAFFVQKVTTLTDGYENTGLNLRTRTTTDQLRTLILIYKEAAERRLILVAQFWIYFFMRFIRAFIKK